MGFGDLFKATQNKTLQNRIAELESLLTPEMRNLLTIQEKIAAAQKELNHITKECEKSISATQKRTGDMIAAHRKFLIYPGQSHTRQRRIPACGTLLPISSTASPDFAAPTPYQAAKGAARRAVRRTSPLRTTGENLAPLPAVCFSRQLCPPFSIC